MNRHRRPQRLAANLSTALTLAVTAGLAPAGHALNIVFTPLSQNNNPQISGVSADFNPQDVSGNGLLTVLNHVGDVYERVIDDPGTVEITYWWDDISLVGQSSPSWIVENNGRVTMSGVRFNSDLVGNFGLPWFIDSTPAQDEEFDMNQRLFRDLPANTQDARYLGDTPDLFEAAFSGGANGNAPGGNFFDLVTVAFQEVGHALGMNAGFSNVSNNSNTGEGDDFKFDLPTGWVHGDTMALKARGFSNPNAGDGKDHIVGNDVVMGGVNGRQRNRPSAADILSIAVTGNYNSPDLPRKEFLGGVQWDNGFNWLGGKAPGVLDDVFVRHGSPSSVVVDEGGLTLVQNLTVAEGSNLLVTDGATLVVLDETVVERADPAVVGSTGIAINADSELDASLMRINEGGTVSVFNGLLDVEDLRIGEGGRVAGNGTVRFIDRLRNDGEIAASNPFGLGINVLSIVSDDGAPVDLDGTTGNGAVTANFASVQVLGALNDAFDGTIYVGDGRFFGVNQAWTLGAQGLIELDGGNSVADRARVAGAALNAPAGDIEASGHAHFDNDVTLGPLVTVSLADNANLEFNGETTVDGGTYHVGQGAILEFDGPTTVDTATFDITGNGRVAFDGPTTFSFQTQMTANGLIQQTGDATVIGSMTVNGGVFDMDGFNGNTTINLGNAANNGSLTLNVDAIDEVVNRFDGTINTAQSGLTGRLTVNLPGDEHWIMDGTLNLVGAGSLFRPTRVAGSRMAVAGTVNLTNNSPTNLAADVDFNPSAVVNASGLNSSLAVSGATRVFAGAEFNGFGSLINNGELTLLDDADTGLFSLTNNGTLEVGDSPGSATAGGFTQNASGTWVLELGGDSPGSGFDRLRTNAASLAGTLDVRLINGYLPGLGTDHVFLTTEFPQADIGTFDTLLLPIVNGLTFDVLYSPTSVALRVVEADLVPGDFDGDGDVDAFDLGIWQTGFGTTSGATWADGDADDDGDVDAFDLGLWQTNFGTGVGSASVPEPGAAALVILTLCPLVVRRPFTHQRRH